MSELGIRIAILDINKCKPDKCAFECKRFCPVVMMGKQCIVVGKTSKSAIINESLCIGCGICTHKCPFSAISIVKVPNLSKSEVLHQYGVNSFRLHKLCRLKKGVVIGLLGANGIGKSTLLKILANKIQPNFGNIVPLASVGIDSTEIITHFRGNESSEYFEKLYAGIIKPIIKPQHIEFQNKDNRMVKDVISIETMGLLELTHLSDRKIETLSGGELQRLSIGIVGSRHGNSMLFDEPTNYLDIRQRVLIARYIRNLSQSGEPYIVVCDHDISILDYISNYVHLFMGQEGIYGIVSQLYTTRQGINIYLDGYSPSDNMRFRTYPITFKPP